MKKSGMYNFLIELLIVIVFFALSMIVVVNIFNKGDVLGDKTRVLNEAHSTYISVIEKMKEYDGEELDTYLKDYDIFISTPSVIGKTGVYENNKVTFDELEKLEFEKSVNKIKQKIKELI